MEISSLRNEEGSAKNSERRSSMTESGWIQEHHRQFVLWLAWVKRKEPEGQRVATLVVL